MKKRLGEFIEKVKNDFNLRCCGTKHEDWHFYLNLNDSGVFYKSGFVSFKRHVKSEIASSEFIIYVLIEAIASVKFFKGIDSSDSDNFYKFLVSNGYEDLSYESFTYELDQWLYTEDYQMFINGYYLSKYIKENVMSGELKMFAQFVKNDEFYSRIVDYFSLEFTSSRGLRAYNNEYLALYNSPISEFTQNVLSYGYEKSKLSPNVFTLAKPISSETENLEDAVVESAEMPLDDSVKDVEEFEEVSCEPIKECVRVDDNVKYEDSDKYDIVDKNQISLMDLDGEIETSDIELAFVDEASMLDEVEDFVEQSFIEDSFIDEFSKEELVVKEESFKYETNEVNEVDEIDEISDSCEVKEESHNQDDIIVEQYTTTILDDSDEIYLFKVKFTEEEMELAETIINRSLKLFQIDLIENCSKFKVFTELSQYVIAANVILGKIILLKDSPFDAIKMNMYEAESIKYVLSKSKIKEHDPSIRELYLRVENLFKYQTEIDSKRKEEYYKYIDGKSNSSIMKIIFENK